jgi:hypothetical protein
MHIKKTCILAASQHKWRNPMYDIFKPIELNKTYQQVEGAIKSGYNFWLDVVADTLKMYKTK